MKSSDRIRYMANKRRVNPFNKLSSLSLLTLSACILLAACGQSHVVRNADTKNQQKTTSDNSHAKHHASQSIPRDGIYRVKSGDTLYGISSRFGLKLNDLAAWNQINAPYLIRVGQRLLLRPEHNSSHNPKHSNTKTSTANKATNNTPKTTPPPVINSNDAVATANMPHWRWPTQGTIIGRYVAGDPTQQGINIAGKSGQAIAAAADGLVVYSGAGLVGYGELIIIKHSEQWLSAYAHNQRRLVAEGVQVKRGEIIAEMGRSGTTRDMLHFEIRRNGKPIDPLAFLPAQ